MDDLRAALLALRRTDMPDGSCWCSVAPNKTVGPRHERQCRDTRAALAATVRRPAWAPGLAEALHEAGIGCMRPVRVCDPSDPRYADFHPAAAKAIFEAAARLHENPDPQEPGS